MSGDIGIPFVLQLKDGVNAIHLTDFEGLTQSVEDSNFFRSLTNGSSFVEQVEQQMCIQPVTHILNNTVQLIDNGVQIVQDDVQVLDNNVQIVDNTGHIIDENVQIVDSSGKIVENERQLVNNSIQLINNNMQIVTSDGQILDNNIHIVDNNIKIVNGDSQIINKNVHVDNNIGSTVKMDVGLNDIETKGVVNFIYEVVYPEQLNLKFKGLKRGRPKKIKTEEPESVKPIKTCKPAPKTRSGRVVRFPKYIEKDFKKAEFEETISENGERELKAADFEQYTEEPATKPPDYFVKMELQQLKTTKRTIAAQYRCPKCQKAYLGKTKMIQHIKKYPDHGPLPVPRNENNFDVWNYLVDITQKSPPAQRGVKFCGELTNLLHNVLLLTSALFKEVEANKTYVEVDKVLGNAIGVPPGQYKFNDTELYKDVTVLKLITNTDFFKPVSVSKETINENKPKKVMIEEIDTKKGNISVIKTDVDNETDETNCDIDVKPNHTDIGMLYFGNVADKNAKEDISAEYQSVSETNNESSESITCKETKDANIPNEFNKKPLSTSLDDRISVQQELMSENSLLHLPNLRTAVDDLMLTGVDSGSTLLDNSASSDEVMNVDQFVNERFKKITEPDLDMSGGGLNLDLPPLDLFQFHTN